ncbi:hypothetical protein U1Q18_024346 [Sarracenia purpurea var. burkii]
MSLRRRSFLWRRISSRSFAYPKSFSEKTLEAARTYADLNAETRDEGSRDDIDAGFKVPDQGSQGGDLGRLYRQISSERLYSALKQAKVGGLSDKTSCLALVYMSGVERDHQRDC